MKSLKIFPGICACLLLAFCNRQKHIGITQYQTATKFNGKIINQIYYDDTFNYKIKIPANWVLFDEKDFSRGVNVSKYVTLLVGFTSVNRNTIYFYDVDLASYNNSFNSLMKDYKKSIREEFLSLGEKNNAYSKIYEDYPTNNCFKEYRIDLYDKATNKFDMSSSVEFEYFKTNHAIVGINVITTEDHLPALKETLDFICNN